MAKVYRIYATLTNGITVSLRAFGTRLKAEYELGVLRQAEVRAKGSIEENRT